MYIKDGSNLDYAGTFRPEKYQFKTLYAWGWLGDEVKSRGWKSKATKEQVVKKLKDSKKFVVDVYCGVHCCLICFKEGMSQEVEFNGSIKIAHNEKIYCCPMGVEHYIEKHDYKPADEVVEAILNGHYIENNELL